MRILLLIWTLFFCSAFVTSSCVSERQNGNGRPSVSAARRSVKKVPIEIPITNQLYVQARINGSALMWFVVDTGSTWTFLDATKAKELNIATEGGRTVETGKVHALTMTFARDTTLEISGVKVAIQELAVMPLKFRHAPQLVGIIGSDLFERFVVEIDYTARSLELFEPNDYAYKGPGEILTMEVIEKIPHIVVNISRGSVNLVPAKLLVDTGAAQSVVLYAPFIEKNKLLETTTGTIQIAAGGLGGGSLMRKVRAKVVKIGRLTFDRPLIYFAPQKRAAEWRDGILGNDLLDRFKVIIDYSRRKVILEPSARLNAPTDFSSYQFDLIREGKRYKVAESLREEWLARRG